MFSKVIMAPCWESNDGRHMHYFSGGPTCHCGKVKAEGVKPCIRTHLRLVDEHGQQKLDL